MALTSSTFFFIFHAFAHSFSVSIIFLSFNHPVDPFPFIIPGCNCIKVCVLPVKAIQLLPPPKKREKKTKKKDVNITSNYTINKYYKVCEHSCTAVVKCVLCPVCVCASLLVSLFHSLSQPKSRFPLSPSLSHCPIASPFCTTQIAP